MESVHFTAFSLPFILAEKKNACRYQNLTLDKRSQLKRDGRYRLAQVPETYYHIKELCKDY
jgi:hypothetical protein